MESQKIDVRISKTIKSSSFHKLYFPFLKLIAKDTYISCGSKLMLMFLCSALIGSMIFFTVVVSPSAFSSLGSEESSKFLRTVFPRMFLFGATLSLLIFIVAIITNTHILITSGSICAILFGINRNYLTPKINSSRDKNQKSTFRILHFWSVALFLAVLILMIVSVICLQSIPTYDLW